MHRATTLVATALVLATASVGRADTALPPTIRAVHAKGAGLVSLIETHGRGAGARLRVGKARPVTLHDGDVAGTVVTGHGRVVVALATDDADAPFQVVALDGVKLTKPALLARPEAREGFAFAVAATATPDGFAVFFQEVEAADPSAAHTYLVKLDADGQPAGAAVEVPVPWSLAAAAWNGAGYHLALTYASSGGMRLSMVSLTAAGQPQQHPDWASRAGFIADVHLVARDGRVRAFYRGGGGDRLHERDVTTIGAWGTEPAKARDHGALPWSKAIAIDERGRPTKVAAPRAQK